MKRIQVFALLFAVFAVLSVGAFYWQKSKTPMEELALSAGIQLPRNSKIILWKKEEATSLARVQIPLNSIDEFAKNNKLEIDKMFPHELNSQGHNCSPNGEDSVFIRLFSDSGLADIVIEKSENCRSG